MSTNHYERRENDTSSTEKFHGGPDVRAALHLNDVGYDYKGKRVLFAGNLTGRWSFGDQMRDRGADVNVYEVGSIANPQTSLKKNSQALKSQYDLIVYSRVMAFKKGNDLQGIISASLDAINVEREGEFSSVDYDLVPSERYAAAHPEEPASGLIQLLSRFDKVLGIDSYRGHTIKSDIRNIVAARPDSARFVVSETINERPQGPQYWHEIVDLCDMLGSVSGEAIAGMNEAPWVIRKIVLGKQIEALESLGQEFADYKKMVEKDILTRPLGERPDGGVPPVIHTVTVKAESLTDRR